MPIEDFHTWCRTLSQQEMLDLYNRGIGIVMSSGIEVSGTLGCSMGSKNILDKEEDYEPDIPEFKIE